MSCRKRVNILSNTKGGVFSFTTSLSKMLIERNYVVNILFLSQPKKNRMKTDSKHLHVEYLTLNSVPNLRTLVNFLFRNNSDILQINFASFGPLAVWKKLLFRTPYILTLHGLPHPWLQNTWRSKAMYSMESLMVPFAAKHASTTIVVSNHVKNELRARYGLNSRVIYLGLDARNAKIENKKDARKRLGIPEDDPIILFVGSLNLAKDPLTLIRAFSHVVRVRNSYLMMAGAGELSEQVADTVKEMGIQENVKLLGQLRPEELVHYYNAADIFVLPSVSEAFGTVLLEAMAFGLPAVVSNSCACSEIIGEAGVGFEKGDSTALAGTIVQLMQDKELSKRLGLAGQKRVIEVFSLEEEARQYCGLFEKIIGDTR